MTTNAELLTALQKLQAVQAEIRSSLDDLNERITAEEQRRETPIPRRCPTWCRVDDCHGDHDAELSEWGQIRVHVFPDDEIRTLSVKPTWCEMDGLPPQLSVFLDGDKGTEFYLTPQRARELAQYFLNVAHATERG